MHEERREFQAELARLARINHAGRIFQVVCMVWGAAMLGLEFASFPQFLFEWYGGVPFAFSTASIAFLWASGALWAGGFRIGYQRVTPQVIVREQTPGTFWRGILIALALGSLLTWFGVSRLAHLRP